MHLLEIALYNDEGEKRTITFRPGELNVITGASLKGKSSLVGIIRYLLGGGSPHAPSLIRNAVAWYGLLARVNGQTFFVGRPRVGANQTSSRAMLLPQAEASPDFADLEAGDTTDSVRAFIGDLLGIEANENVPEPGQTRRPLSATFVHSLYYCFLEQGEIANPRSLFHRQARDFQPQTIRDTLPYFLGAQGRREMELRGEVRQRRRQLRDLERRLGEIAAFRQQESATAVSLLAQARDFGLLDAEAIEQAEDPILLLTEAVRFDALDDRSESVPTDEYDRLIEESQRLRETIREQGAQVRRLERFAEVNAGYADEAGEQSSRLNSLGLLPLSGDSSPCPVCGQTAALEVEHLKQQMLDALGASELRGSSAARDRLRVEGAVSELRQELQANRERYGGVLEGIRDLDTVRETEQSRARRIEMRSYVAGRIAQFIESSSAAQDLDVEVLQARVATIRGEISNLEAQVDGDAVRSRTQSLINLVSRRMTELARRMRLEHADTGVRIDPQRLTIVADLADGPAYMSENEIGSGMNWVGYHLATYMALQEFFLEHSRPVPSFVVFDQPTQVFFPEEASPSTEIDEWEESDQELARQLFELMRDVVAESKGALQVIVLDHADFADDWFRESVVERWRGSNALIPQSWIADSAENEVQLPFHDLNDED